MHRNEIKCVICDGIDGLMAEQPLHAVVQRIMADARNRPGTVPICPRHRRQLSAAVDQLFVDRLFRVRIEAN
jgi:hypothetical protein